jgi:hypothetical protein
VIIKDYSIINLTTIYSNVTNQAHQPPQPSPPPLLSEQKSPPKSLDSINEVPQLKEPEVLTKQKKSQLSRLLLQNPLH